MFHSKNLIVAFLALFFVTIVLVGNSPSSEVYPNKPITVVSTVGPGMQDTITRAICRAAERELGQPIIVENKPGAAGTIGMNYALKSKPDGYTLVAFVTSAYNIIPHMRKVPYNPFVDSVDITTFFKYNFALAVRAEAPWKTFEELMVFAKKHPGEFKYACAGVGRPQHLCMEWIAMKEGIKWTQIPFNSGSETVAACLGGHADGITQGTIDLVPNVKAGKMRLLLILEEKRWSGFPNVPCMVEKGYDFYPVSYGSLAAPKGIPESILTKLEGAFNKAKADNSVVEMLDKFQVGPGNLTGREYAKLWRSKNDENGKVIKALGLGEE